MLHLVASETELTTAATDAALGLVCLVLLVSLVRRRSAVYWGTWVWAAVFALLAAGSALGAIAHGFEWSATARARLWAPLNLSLGLAVALFVVGAAGDWGGRRRARAVLPWAVAAAIGFFVVTRLSDDFTWFIVYEGVAMLLTLVIYLHLWRARRWPGAAAVAAGIVLTMAAAVVQVSSLSARIVWPFDHNGLFHIVQIAGVLVIARGVRAGTDAAPAVAGA